MMLSVVHDFVFSLEYPATCKTSPVLGQVFRIKAHDDKISCNLFTL